MPKRIFLSVLNIFVINFSYQSELCRSNNGFPLTRPRNDAEPGEGVPSIELPKRRIHRGCDFHLSLDNVQSAMQDPTRFTINGLSYLMVEFAETIIPTSTEEIFRLLLERGVTPVITHPERNPILQDSFKRLSKWIEMGCLLQITAQCLTDRFGKAAELSARALLKMRMVHVIASDAHDTQHRPPRLDLAREILTRELGSDVAAMLLEDNPAAIIAGREILVDAPEQGDSQKKWFHFWK